MNSDLLFEISKFIDAPVGIPGIQEAMASEELRRRNRIDIQDFLNKKLGDRPAREELEYRNIIKKDSLSFSRIHEMLNRINFTTVRRCKIAPSIAGKVSKLDFYLKKKILINKLGIEEYERIYKKD